MTADKWRALMLTALAAVLCVGMFRACRQVLRAGGAFDPQVLESVDPDETCWNRCQGPWTSYTRSSNGEDHCHCVVKPR